MVLADLAEALQQGDRDRVSNLVIEALANGIAPEVLLNKGLITGMDEVGLKFQKGEIYIPHMLIAARAMYVALDILKPKLVETGAKSTGKVVLGTVQGDHHDIGKNLVSMMFQGKGLEVVDIGIDVPPSKFVGAVSNDVQIVAMSALLSTTAPFMARTIEALEEAGLRHRIKIMVGGGVVTREFADRIGADAYGEDAATAAKTAIALLK